jgi:hypothetical protein
MCIFKKRDFVLNSLLSKPYTGIEMFVLVSTVTSVVKVVHLGGQVYLGVGRKRVVLNVVALFQEGEEQGTAAGIGE